MKSTAFLTFAIFCLACLAPLVALPGCSQGGYPTADVTGKVIHDGQAVTGGSLTFAPMTGTVGKPASGIVNPDGSFVLATYGKRDGAVVGKHKVMYYPPAPDVEEEPSGDSEEHAEQSPSKLPFSGLVPKVSEVEVTSGSNEINIELVAQTRRAR
jgi:hypothetical protein